MAKERILTAAHRGVSGGNIPCNTIAAYEIALRQGADIVEIDISRSIDGKLYVFHPGMEPAHLGSSKYIKEMFSKEIDELYYINQDDVKTLYKINTLDEVLEHLKGRCIVNVDKFWMWMDEIVAVIRRHGMEQQVLVKTPDKLVYYDMLEAVAPDLAFMPMVWNKDNCTENLTKRNINYVGVETLFSTENDEVVQDEYIESMHNKGLILWANAIVYDYKQVISAGHTDDLSLTDDPDKGWGWLAKKRFDIIQTDWTLPLRQYLQLTK